MRAVIRREQTLEIAQADPAKPDSVFEPAAFLMAGRFLAFAITAFVPLVLVRALDRHEFGTYKQLFLISSTITLIAQFGVATSLFYFLPKAPLLGARYVCNAVFFLTCMGLLSVAALEAGRWRVAEWLNNPALPQYMLWIGLYTAFLMVSVTLEIVMICRGHYLKASAAYALSDSLRALGFLVPVLLGARLRGLLAGGVTANGARLVAMLFYFGREYEGAFRPDLVLLRKQLAYAVPFGSAVLLEVLVNNFHHYFVSSRFDAATFAIYAAGCLQIPLVDFVATPTSDVMMVKMREALEKGESGRVRAIWHETTRKLALIFLPLVALSLVAAPELIVTLYTSSYAESIPVFMAWSLAILFSAVPVDGVMRVYAQTRFLFINNFFKLCLTIALVGWFVELFQLVGAVTISLFASLVARVAGLVRMRRMMGIRWPEVLPWGSLGRIAGAAAAAAIPALLIKASFESSPVSVLMAATLTYTLSYGIIVPSLGLLTVSERIALRSWLKKAWARNGGSS